MFYDEIQKQLGELKSNLSQFKIEFLDREGFEEFADSLFDEVGGYSEIWITGYFSEAIRNTLERLACGHKLKLLSQEFDLNNKREKRNLEVMRKLCNAGVEVKINNRLHARFLLAHSPAFPAIGLLVIGSFDFNMEGMSKERYDAGIKTNNPDLVISARELFNQIWNEPESLPFTEKYPEH